MARSVPRFRIFDQLQSHPFWIIDLSLPWKEGWQVLMPILGFSTATAPEITLNTQEIKQGNAYFPHHVVTGATVAPITLTRGVSMFYGGRDFYRWMSNALIGRKTPRRDLMMIHYSTLSLEGMAKGIENRTSGTALADQLLSMLATFGGSAAIAAQMTQRESAVLAAGGGATTAVGRAAQLIGMPTHEIVRIPARTWLLRKCLPIRWKAGTDFDATAATVSIAELEIQPQEVVERSVG